MAKKTISIEQTVQGAPKMLMTKGSGGNLDYAVIARKGDVVLSIKPNIIIPGEPHGAPGTTYVGARLRSSPAGDLFDKEEADTAGIVIFGTVTKDLGAMWPNVEWETVDNKRASTQIAVLVPGDPQSDPEKLLEGVKEKRLSQQFTEALVALAEPDNLVTTPEAIRDYLESQFAPTFEKVLTVFLESKAYKEEAAANVGKVLTGGALMKKAKETALKPNLVPKVEDEPEVLETKTPAQILQLGVKKPKPEGSSMSHMPEPDFKKDPPALGVPTPVKATTPAEMIAKVAEKALEAKTPEQIEKAVKLAQKAGAVGLTIKKPHTNVKGVSKETPEASPDTDET
jgi:hypothetical protein